MRRGENVSTAQCAQRCWGVASLLGTTRRSTEAAKDRDPAKVLRSRSVHVRVCVCMWVYIHTYIYNGVYGDKCVRCRCVWEQIYIHEEKNYNTNRENVNTDRLRQIVYALFNITG